MQSKVVELRTTHPIILTAEQSIMNCNHRSTLASGCLFLTCITNKVCQCLCLCLCEPEGEQVFLANFMEQQSNG